MPANRTLLGPVAHQPVNYNHPLNYQRVAWWLTLPHLYGGVQWYDLLGSSHGTLTGMTTSTSGWKPSPRPGGWGHLAFDGSNDYVDAGNSPLLDITGSLTMSAWVRCDSFSQSYKLIMAKGVPDSSGRNYSFGIDPANGNRGIYPQIVGVGGFNPDTIQMPVANAMATGVWYHLVVVYDNAAQTLTIYQNGKQTNQLTGLTGSPTPNSLNMSIGQGGVWGWMNGALDDLSVWGRALSAAETWALYASSLRGYPDLLRRRSNLSRVLGVSVITAVGSAAGIANATGIGKGVISSVGSAAGIATSSGIGSSLKRAQGSASGVSTASGVGTPLVLGVGSAAGMAAASGVGNGVFSAVGSAVGIATGSGIGFPLKKALGSATGVSTVAGIGASVARGVGSAAGIATGSAAGARISRGVGSAAAMSICSGHGFSIVPAMGTAVGSSTSLGLSPPPFLSVVGSEAGSTWMERSHAGRSARATWRMIPPCRFMRPLQGFDTRRRAILGQVRVTPLDVNTIYRNSYSRMVEALQEGRNLLVSAQKALSAARRANDQEGERRATLDVASFRARILADQARLSTVCANAPAGVAFLAHTALCNIIG